MSDEVATTQPVELFNPATGEMVDLASETNVLARYLADVREFEHRLRDAKRAASAELLARMDREAKWSIHMDGLKITGDGPGRTEYDAHQLFLKLLPFVQEQISEEALDAAVQREVVYKAKVAGIRALEKLGGDIAKAIAECEHPTERPRQVRVGVA